MINFKGFLDDPLPPPLLLLVVDYNSWLHALLNSNLYNKT